MIALVSGILSLIFYIVFFVGAIMLIVHGFKKDTTWGIINLLVPFGFFVFMFKYPEEAQPGRKVTLIGLVGSIACLILTILTAPAMV